MSDHPDFWPVGMRVEVLWLPGGRKAGTIVKPTEDERVDASERMVRFDDLELGRKSIYTGLMGRGLEFEAIAGAMAQGSPLRRGRNHGEVDCIYCGRTVGNDYELWEGNSCWDELRETHTGHRVDCLWVRARRAFGLGPLARKPSSDEPESDPRPSEGPRRLSDSTPLSECLTGNTYRRVTYSDSRDEDFTRPKTIGDLRHVKRSQLLSLQTFGMVSLKEVEVVAAKAGVSLREETPADAEPSTERIQALETLLIERMPSASPETIHHLAKSIGDLNMLQSALLAEKLIQGGTPIVSACAYAAREHNRRSRWQGVTRCLRMIRDAEKQTTESGWSYG